MKERECSSDKMIVTNIQRMCMHDGPGIRTTVFMKGCNLHCPWCANPENMNMFQESYMTAAGKEGIYGLEYSADDLFKEVMKDLAFWKSGGGVTFSGGEPLLQAAELVDVLVKLKEKGVHIAFETALMTDKSLLEMCISYVDLFIVDMKILLPDLCREVLGGNIDNYFKNLDFLSMQKKEILFRIPCNREYTMRTENLDRMKSCLGKYSQYNVEIFAMHSLARDKYECLGKPFTEYEEVPQEELQILAKEFSSCGNAVRVNSL